MKTRFFIHKNSGGTIISTAYAETIRIIKDRFPVSEWNIYVAQASDGDNISSDNDVCHEKLSLMLPWIQYLTYIEVRNEQYSNLLMSKTEVWEMLEQISGVFPEKIAMRKINDKSEIVDVFRSLFKKKNA